MKAASNKYRIIGGHWRGRALTFPDAPGLRPTTGRIRETLFNWLQQTVSGARCLDLFAGSGALGFEALSRGAAAVTAVEIAPRAAGALERNRDLLAADRLDLVRADALSWLDRPASAGPFDIVFLDPPYGSRCLARCCELLEKHQWLSEEAFIYLEDGDPLSALPLPPGWSLLKGKQAGQVHYGLCRRLLQTR